ncbi:MAG: hypothetical protein L0Z70_01185 [Chloroflexi bacterium]|nr:hypothetical protein [Chloroflexota bacterium]
MREWNLKSGDPLSLALAADARLGAVDYLDDQVWELRLSGGDPPALALHTTYGLRARALRLFPRFSEGDRTVNDPAEFHRPPAVRQVYPNYCCVHFAPFADIDVEAEYWVPQSRCVAGRLRLLNRGRTPRQVRLSWAALLSPSEGQRMAPTEFQSVSTLEGQSDGLHPVVFLSGGPEAVSSPFPALNLEITIKPGGAAAHAWACAALASPDASFDLARQTASRHWEAEIARLELLNASLVEVHSGNADWDAAFTLAQNLAYASFTGPTQHLPAASFVLSRQPDSGHSMRGDGTDYNHLCNGQTALDAYYLASLLLPGGASLVEGVLRNYLAVQDEDGAIDWKPGLAGQRSRLLATPILAALAWRVFDCTQNHSFLQEAFPRLLSFLQLWFDPRHDRDGDGVPEWDHPMQAGFDDHPLFSRWHAWAQGVEISTAESPALCALLYRECQALMRMAALVERSETIPALQSLADNLRAALQAAWSEERATYSYWDRDTHRAPHGQLLGKRTGPGEMLIQRSFDPPIRPLIRVHASTETTLRPRGSIHGAGASGQHRVENIAEERFRWFERVGVLTGERVYAAIESLAIQGIGPDDRVSLYSVDYDCSDHTVLLPLWAGIPTPEQAEALVRRTLVNGDQYWRAFGVPPCPAPPLEAPESVCFSVNLPWNAMLGEGLAAYGYQEDAAELTRRLMTAVTGNLKEQKAFQRFYHALNGQGIGERHSFSGAAPLGLFLESLGVRLLAADKVFLWGINPYPWNVTVKYRGMSVVREQSRTLVVFSDGHSVTVKDPSPQLVTLALQ